MLTKVTNMHHFQHNHHLLREVIIVCAYYTILCMHQEYEMVLYSIIWYEESRSNNIITEMIDETLCSGLPIQLKGRVCLAVTQHAHTHEHM